MCGYVYFCVFGVYTSVWRSEKSQDTLGVIPQEPFILGKQGPRISNWPRTWQIGLASWLAGLRDLTVSPQDWDYNCEPLSLIFFGGVAGRGNQTQVLMFGRNGLYQLICSLKTKFVFWDRVSLWRQSDFKILIPLRWLWDVGRHMEIFQIKYFSIWKGMWILDFFFNRHKFP